MALTDENFGFIMGNIRDRPRTLLTTHEYESCDRNLSMEPGTTSQMSRVMYYTLGSLLEDAPWMILDTTPDMNGFEALRRGICIRNK